MSTFQRFLPWAVAVLGIAFAASMAVPPSPKAKNGFDYNSIGQLPVLEGGRIKPLDTVARTALLAISEQEEYKDRDGKKQPAIRWLMDVMSHDPIALDHEVFRITNDQLLSFLDLKKKPGNYRYSWSEMFSTNGKFRKFATEVDRVEKMPKKKRDRFHDKILELAQRIRIYEEFNSERINLREHDDEAAMKAPGIVPVPGQEAWQTLAQVDEQIVKPQRRAIAFAVQERVKKELQRAGTSVTDMTEADQVAIKRGAEQLEQMFARQIAEKDRPSANPAAEEFHNILRSYAAGDAEKFNQLVQDFTQKYHANLPAPIANRVHIEWYFNQFSPFYVAGMLYLFVLALTCLGWLVWPQELQLSAFSLAAVAFTVHSLGLIGRMYLQGRPPVTNLYASSVFIGWGGVLLCLGMERIYRNGIGNFLASVVGASTMFIALKLAESLALAEGSDTLQTLVAVLDTNIWLATHVTTVTLGYTATYVAAFIGVVYIFRGIFTSTLDASSNKIMGQMLYGVICFATFLSFVGTVLGGIWADQSWGRFWGWDPKENGAVLIVIWNALILHARWAGLVKQRGIAVLAVVGAMITTWSWYGTNQLGVGLHAYGFDKSLADACRTCWLICLAIISIGLLPLRYWRSFAEQYQANAGQSALSMKPKSKLGGS